MGVEPKKLGLNKRIASSKRHGQCQPVALRPPSRPPAAPRPHSPHEHTTDAAALARALHRQHTHSTQTKRAGTCAAPARAGANTRASQTTRAGFHAAPARAGKHTRNTTITRWEVRNSDASTATRGGRVREEGTATQTRPRDGGGCHKHGHGKGGDRGRTGQEGP